MNIKVLKKLECGWIKLESLSWIHTSNLKPSELESIVDTIERFIPIRRVQELVIAKYSGVVPIYVTVRRREYTTLLELIKERMIVNELYEICERIVLIIKRIRDECN